MDQAGTEDRRRRTVRRRVYIVPSPNYMWHIDGNHKLIICWHFVVHGGIDGYSRMITYLKCANNRASTVAESFDIAISTYGIPARVQSDHGGENVDVWQFMVGHHNDESCVTVGSSTHNERIERLCGEIYEQVYLNRLLNCL